MPTPIVSVILPYHNAENTLEQAILSILNQTFKDFELILINNNSSDGSPEIAARKSKKDERIRLITEPKQGVVFAFNKGLFAAKGGYIARMDADDFSHPERLASQIDYLYSHPEISICATQVNYRSQEPSGFHHFVGWSNALNTWQEIFHNRFVEFPIVNPTLMFRKAILEDVGYFREGDFPEDYEWFLRAVDQGYKFAKIPRPLLDWWDSGERLTRSDPRYSSEAFFAIKTYYLSRHLKKINQPKVWIWGAGKLGYKRSQHLLQYGMEIEGYIDIKKEKKLKNYRCVHHSDLHLAKQPFILSYITNRNRRDEIRAFLNDRGYIEASNYIVVG